MTAGKGRLENDGHSKGQLVNDGHSKGQLVNDGHRFDSFQGHSPTFTPYFCTPQGTQDLIDNPDWAYDGQVGYLTVFSSFGKLDHIAWRRCRLLIVVVQLQSSDNEYFDNTTSI